MKQTLTIDLAAFATDLDGDSLNFLVENLVGGDFTTDRWRGSVLSLPLHLHSAVSASFTLFADDGSLRSAGTSFDINVTQVGHYRIPDRRLLIRM